MARQSEWTAQKWQAQISEPSLSLCLSLSLSVSLCLSLSVSGRYNKTLQSAARFTKTATISAYAPRLFCAPTKTLNAPRDVSVYQRIKYLYIRKWTLRRCQPCHCIYQNSWNFFICSAAALPPPKKSSSWTNVSAHQKHCYLYTKLDSSKMSSSTEEIWWHWHGRSERVGK